MNVAPALSALVLAPLLCSAAQSRKLNGPLAPAADENGGARILDSAITADGARVVYRGDHVANGIPRLYSVPIDGSSAPLALNLVRTFSFELSPDGTRAAYVATAGLFRVPVDGSAAPDFLFAHPGEYDFTPDSAHIVCNDNGSLRAGPATGGHGWTLSTQLTQYTIAPDSAHVVYFVRAFGQGDRVYSVPVVGGASELLLDYVVDEFAISPDSTRCLVRGSGELFCLRLDGSAEPVELSQNVTDFAFLHNDSSVVLFTRFTNGRRELFSVPIDGGTTTQLSGAFVAGGSIDAPAGQPAFLVSSDDAHVVYRADQETDGVFHLYSVSLTAPGTLARVEQSGAERFELTPDGSACVFEVASGGAPAQLFGVSLANPAAPVCLSGAMPVNGGLQAFALAPDSLTAVYNESQDSLAVELYRAPIDGSAPATKLNAPLQIHGNVQGSIAPAFQVAPAGARVVYRADQETDELHELFSVPLGGGPAQRLNAALAPSVPAGNVRNFFALDPLGEHVVYQATGDRQDVVDLYRVNLTGTPVEERLGHDQALSSDVDHTALSADGRWVVYTAGPDLDQRFDCFSLDLQGDPTPICLSAALQGRSTGRVLVSPDSTRAVFTAGRDENPINGIYPKEIFTVPLDGSTPPVRITTSMNFNGVSAFRITADGQRIVVAANLNSLGKLELYSAPLDGSAPTVRLSATQPNFAALVEPTEAQESFELDSSGRWVAYIADQEVNARFELYFTRTDGSWTRPVKLNGPLPLAGDVARFEITSASDLVIYTASQEVNGRDELYTTAFGDARARRTGLGHGPRFTKLSGPLAANASVGSFMLTPDEKQVVYRAQQQGDAERCFYVVDVQGRTPARRLCEAVNATWRLTPDGARIVFGSTPNTLGGVTQLYSVPLDGSAGPVRLNPTLPGEGNVMASGQPSPSFLVTPDSATVVYLADQNANDRFELFAVDVAGTSPAVRLNGTLVNGGDVGGDFDVSQSPFRLTLDGSQVLYLADQDRNGVLELYASPLP